MYRIIFQGQIGAGHDAETVKAALAKLFRLDDEQRLARLFSGKPITIKKSLDENGARTYLAAIERTGARVTVEPPLPTVQDDPADTQAAQATHNQSTDDQRNTGLNDEPSDDLAGNEVAANNDDLSFQTVMQSFSDEPLATTALPATESADNAETQALDQPERTSRRARRWLPFVFGAAAALLVSLLLINQFQRPDAPLAAAEQANLQALFTIAADGSDAEYAEALATVDDADTRQAMAELRDMVSDVREEYPE